MMSRSPDVGTHGAGAVTKQFALVVQALTAARALDAQRQAAFAPVKPRTASATPAPHAALPPHAKALGAVATAPNAAQTAREMPQAPQPGMAPISAQALDDPWHAPRGAPRLWAEPQQLVSDAVRLICTRLALNSDL